MQNKILRVLLGLSLLCTVQLVTALSASAQTTNASTGFDVSFPQCGRSLPEAGFGIVGVNGGHPFSTNPCLASELAWAKTTTSGAPSFYMNTGSPGPADTSLWPTSQTSPVACSGANSPACSYDWGWNAAKVSYENALTAETQDGASSPSTAVIGAKWWLDVETGNMWESIEAAYGPTTASQLIDQSMLLGSIAYLKSAGVSDIGIYSTAQQWHTITGTPPTAFSSIPVWMPGYPTLAAAEAACALSSFTGGRVAMIQYPSQGLDGDYICGLVSTPGAVSISVAASSTFTDQLVVSGATTPVTWVQSAGSPSLVISSTGGVTTSGALAAGTYVATGSTSDTNGDVGLFTFLLNVGTIVQDAPTSATLKTTQTSSFNTQLMVSGNFGTTTFTQSSGAPNLLVSSTGIVTANGQLPAGTYSASGTTSDTSGDVGVFSFSILVGAITQNSPTTGSVTTDASSSFSAQLSVSHNDGTVSFVQLTGAPSLTVSSTGLVTSSSVLQPGNYRATGTTSDPYGDVGTFVFTLSVAATKVAPVIIGPIAQYVVGHAVAGHTVTMQIIGSGFSGRPTVTSHGGTVVSVLSDSGTVLGIRVSVRPRSRNGVFTFTIDMANGTTARVKYNQR